MPGSRRPQEPQCTPSLQPPKVTTTALPGPFCRAGGRAGRMVGHSLAGRRWNLHPRLPVVPPLLSWALGVFSLLL